MPNLPCCCRCERNQCHLTLQLMDSSNLASALTSSFDFGLPCFVLIDPMLGEPLPTAYPPEETGQKALVAARSEAWARSIHIIELSASINLPLHLHPYLVALEGLTDPLIAETVSIALDEFDQTRSDGLAGAGTSAHRIGGWLQSSQSPEALAKVMSSMMRVNTEAYTKARYLRIADRRVLDLLCHVVGSARVTAQFGRVHSWCYLDPVARLTTLQSRSESATPLRLDSAEWASLCKGELLHPTIARWQAELPTQTPRPPGVCYAKATAALEQAEGAVAVWPQRFTSPADRMAWAALTLLHPDIGQTPAVIAALNAEPEPGEPIETLNTLSTSLNALCLKAAI